MRLPTVARFVPPVSESEHAGILAIAEEIRQEKPQLAASEALFESVRVARPLDDAPTLQLDDFSEIPQIGDYDNAQVLQQRARLRAVDGDVVALSRPVEPGFADYCEYRLGLGRVSWLSPAVVPSQPRQLALECWQDRRLRHDLMLAIRQQGLRYIHPHIGTLAVWELAQLLHDATRQPIEVISPTPALAGLANDKIEFTRIVERVLGPSWVPRTEVAYNLTTLAQLTARLVEDHSDLGIKFPYGTGGQGNFRIRAKDFRRLSLSEIRAGLSERLGGRWPASGRVLVDVWELQVLSSPSVQTWIPRPGDPPVIEGLFNQTIVGEEGSFAGSYPVQYPPPLQEEILKSAMLIALLFQQLGYLGRCSFDLILIGDDFASCRVEFIECNGRWGGTSTPMTLVNRLLAPTTPPTYRIGKIQHAILSRLSFAQLTRELDQDLFRMDRQQGHFVLFNPARMRANSSIEVIALGESQKQSEELLHEILPGRLDCLAHRLATVNGQAT